MQIESELKFPVDDFKVVMQRLSRMSGIHSPWYFERNIVLDDEKGSLKNKDFLLRLRTGLNTKLTLKLPVDNKIPGLAKCRQEFETGLEDIDAAQSIFRHLGFKVWLRYEKYRQVWSLNKVEVCLDILPFGRFVEIEGSEDSIIETASMLGLEQVTATARTYFQLNRDHALKQGW